MNKIVVEGFSGTESFSKVAVSRGFAKVSFDFDKSFNPDYCVNLIDPGSQLLFWDWVKRPEVIAVWMSPVCTSFSLASGNTHWNKDKSPKTITAVEGLQMLDFCKRIADYCVANNKHFFIENPNGRSVWFLPKEYLKRVWYCQYGDERAKPTNIWTNLDIEFKTCKNGNPNCHHQSAPRGSKTGTQGLKGSKERSVIPRKLIEFIFDKIQEVNNG